MKIAIDSSVLIGVLKGGAGFEIWREFFIQRKIGGDDLVVCDVVYAEISHAYNEHWEVSKDINDLAIEYDEIKPIAAYRAGTIYRAYRQNGGPKQRVLPDFLVGAHAIHQADALACLDDGYYRDYFNGLQQVTP